MQVTPAQMLFRTFATARYDLEIGKSTALSGLALSRAYVDTYLYCVLYTSYISTRVVALDQRK